MGLIKNDDAMTACVLPLFVLAILAVMPCAMASPGPTPAPAAMPIQPPQDIPYPGTIQLAVDASDTDRKIVRVHETIPIRGTETVLFYPQWIPGTHGPKGPIDRFAGLVIKANGIALAWRRDPGDIYAFHVASPAGASALDVEFDYLSPTSFAVGPVEISPDIVTLRWNTVLLYPAGYFVRQIPVDARITLPAGWQFGTALQAASVSGATTAFKTVTLESLVDSPLYAGRYFARFDLDPDAAVPVHLNVVADSPDLLNMSPAQLEAHHALIQQAHKLFASRHYDHYEFLLALSDKIGFSSFEHHQSSEITTWSRYLIDPDATPYSRDSLPHEYTHSWNGKFRRPADLWTANFNVPMRNTLLWVYEGLTQYWGQILTARCGLWSKQQILDEFARRAAYYSQFSSRRWRSIEDTTNDEIINPRWPQSWITWQGFEDYYSGGLLLWLEADVLIRERSKGQRSLDDFARTFFAMDDGSSTPVTYSFDDVIRTLDGIEPFDWSKFFHDRVDGVGQPAPLSGLRSGGYDIVYTDQPGPYLDAVDLQRDSTDFTFSIGLWVGKDGLVRNVIWDGPAFKANIIERTQIIAVNGTAYSTDALRSAITSAHASEAPIDLIVKSGDAYKVVRIDYHDGLRYPHLVRNMSRPALLDDILAGKN